MLIVRICEEYGASGFVQTQDGLVNGLCVWHWILFYTDWSLLNIYLFGGGEFILLLNSLLWDVQAQRLYIDRNQSYGVDCLCGMPRCCDQGFCCKAKSCGWWSKHGLRSLALCIAWIREPHTSVWVKNGIRTAGRARRFFLAMVVSVTYQPWHLYLLFTFVVVGMRGASIIGL